MAQPSSSPHVSARLRDATVPWLLPAAILVGWQAAVSAGLVSNRFMPAPLDVLRAGRDAVRTGEIWTNLGISTLRALAGFAVGGGIGFALGLANGLSRLSERLTDTSVQMVRNVPHLSLIPLVILWFGIGEEAKLFLVALGVFFPIYANTLHGIRSVDPGLVEMGRVYGMSRTELFTRVVL
ncbi:MAG: ABC transporter permease subunit, partial [Parafilimonas terrae]|nr:ABC transporter permease subunit [Parafilimonas terrae]